MSQIKQICVIGAGVMGAGIAAQIANSQTSVILLDIMPGAAASAKEKMTIGKMPQIAHPSLLQYVKAGDLDESLGLIGSCDWVIEVIVEKLEVKAALYNKIVPYMKDGAVLSSNTSTLPMRELRASLILPTHFLLTHFFNPPRQMQLLELIYDDKTDVDVVKNISDFITHKLGKTIVKSNDTPGFIANRIGCFLMELCLKEAYENKLSIAYIDSYFTKKMGLPSTGIFGLFDLIGLDVMQMISNVLVSSLPVDDAFAKIYKKYDWYDKMLSDGYKGRKGLGGFYRMRDVDGVKVREVLDFGSMEYVDALLGQRHCEEDKVRRGNLTSNNRGIATSSPTPRNDVILSIIEQFFAYVNSLINVVSSSKEDIDTGMRLGYSWKRGPFEMMGDVLASHDVTPYSRKILQNPAAYLCQPVPGTLVFTIQTKMNVLDENVFNLLIGSIDYAEKNNATKFIIYNEGKNFSAGANLNLFADMAKRSDTKAATKFLELGQKAMMKVKYSKVPVVACAKGVALGGGCELLLHAHKVFAHLDLAAGLVEVGVGLIPGWGGVTQMVMLACGDNDKIVKNLRNIIAQNKSSSAYCFFDDYGIENGEVVMNECDLLERAMAWDASSLNYKPLGGSDNKCKIDLISSYADLKLGDHTTFIVKELQDRINSASLLEEQILEIEIALFKKLLVRPKTLEKIKKVI